MSAYDLTRVEQKQRGIAQRRAKKEGGGVMMNHCAYFINTIAKIT